MAASSSSSRKLASVQVVRSILPHPNADNLMIATILGWEAIINKSEGIQEGDVVVYIETDSLLPLDTKCIREDMKTRFKKNKYKRAWWYRVKIISLRGYHSMGLVVPLSMVGEIIGLEDESDTMFIALRDAGAPKDEIYQILGKRMIGDDITSLLGIRKWEAKTFSPGMTNKPKIKDNFPTHILKKTDETRIQTCPEVLETIKEYHTYEIVEKEDGTSGSYFYDPILDTLVVCSRNYSLDEPVVEEETDLSPPYPVDDYIKYYPKSTSGDTSYRRRMCVYQYIAKKYNLLERLRAFYNENCLDTISNNDPLLSPDRKTVRNAFPNIFLQGEIVGRNIQKNLLGLSSIEFRIFNVGYQKSGDTPQRVLMKDVARSYVDGFLNVRFPDYEKLVFAPILEWGDAKDWPYTTIRDHLIPLSKGFYPGTKNHREGLVVRVGGEYGDVRLSFKVINPEYLLKHD